MFCTKMLSETLGIWGTSKLPTNAGCRRCIACDCIIARPRRKS